jgi:heat shock protein HslJ
MLFFLVSGMVFYTGCKKSEIINPPDMSVKGVKWILELIQYSAGNVVPIEDTFYILLKEDFTVEMQVDCNYCGGTYMLGDNNFILFDYSTMVCTEAYCIDSMDAEFHDALNTASRYEVNGNRLRIYFNNEASRLNFIAESS